MERGFLFKRFIWFFGMILISLILESFNPIPAHAIPAFARKYNADCSMCHYPNVPRLNSFGHEFRRAGYRTPEEFNMDQDITEVGNFLAARGRARYNYENPEDGDIESQFQFHDVTLFYSGAMTKNISSFAELEFEPEEKETEIGLVAHIGGVFGKPDHYSTFRIGQFHTLARVGFGGFDRPTGISTALPLSSDLTTGRVRFKINTDQRGLELAHVFKRSRMIAQVLNGVDEEGKGTADDTNTAKDYAFAFEQILDELASGFTLYGYWGTFFDDPDPAIRQRAGFARYALTGNKIFPGVLGGNFELLAGYVRSQDNASSSLGGNVQGNAFFVEIEDYFERHNFTVLARYDFIDPDADEGSDRKEKWTIGYVRTLQSYLRLAVETNITQKDADDSTDYGATGELMVNF